MPEYGVIHRVRATIVREATVHSEPYAKLEGRDLAMPMGLNGRDRSIKEGTTGVAEYHKAPSYGLWLFVPDGG